MIFFPGLHQPSDAQHFGLACVSINRLVSRRKPLLCARVFVDSGAFTILDRHGRYPDPPEVYAAQLYRLHTEGVVEIAVAASQDFMCEPFMLAKTGLTVADHQRLTIERFDAILAELFRLFDGPPPFDLLPVLQGFTVADYLAHLNAYGDRLRPGAWVGVGSVCKRQGSVSVIEEILLAIKEVRPDLRLHGFRRQAHRPIQRPRATAALQRRLDGLELQRAEARAQRQRLARGRRVRPARQPAVARARATAVVRNVTESPLGGVSAIADVSGSSRSTPQLRDPRTRHGPTQDIQRRVVIAIQHHSAVTPMGALLERLGNDHAAGRTCLTRVPGIDLHQHASSLLSFLGEQRGEGRPPGVVYVSGQHPSGEAFDVEVFDSDQVVLADKTRGDLMLERAAGVGGAFTQSRQPGLGFSAITGAPLASGEGALAAALLGVRAATSLEARNALAVRRVDEACYPEVDADAASGRRKRLALDGADQQHDPTLAVSLDLAGQRGARKRAVHVDADAADALHVKASVVDFPPGAVRKAEGVESIPAAEPGKAGTPAGLKASKERLHRKVHPLDRPSLHRAGVTPEVSVRSKRRQSSALFGPRDRAPGLSVAVDPLLKGGVVEVPRVIQGVAQGAVLRLAGKQAVFIGADDRVRADPSQCALHQAAAVMSGRALAAPVSLAAYTAHTPSPQANCPLASFEVSGLLLGGRGDVCSVSTRPRPNRPMEGRRPMSNLPALIRARKASLGGGA